MNTVVLTKYNHYLRILCSQFSVCQIILVWNVMNIVAIGVLCLILRRRNIY